MIRLYKYTHTRLQQTNMHTHNDTHTQICTHTKVQRYTDTHIHYTHIYTYNKTNTNMQTCKYTRIHRDTCNTKQINTPSHT